MLKLLKVYWDFIYQNHTPIFRFEQCLLYIHIHLKPGILAEKNLELLLKPTTAKYVQDRSTNNTICWFTNEIIAKMKINPFSIVMFVAKLSKKWITWKITGKCFSKWTHNFLKNIFWTIITYLLEMLKFVEKVSFNLPTHIFFFLF